jgi:uncharacterized membrane protein YphA (DoxX/SURF4 family)
MNMRIILKHIIQIFAGILFVFSGFFKSLDSQYFSSLINAYGFGWADHIIPFISSFEIILGLCLILNVMPKTTVLITGIFTIIFTIAYIYAYFIRGIEDCGCMGSIIKIPPYLSFVRNMLIIAGCIWIWKNFDNKETQKRNWKIWTICLFGSISFYVSGYTLGFPLFEKSKIHEGDQINSTVLRYFDNKFSKDTSIIFIFRPDCFHCWNTTENVKSIKRTPGFNNVLGLTYAEVDTSQFMKVMQPNFEVLKYPTNELYDYIIGVPVLLILENGKIIRIFKSQDIPCGPMLRRMLMQKEEQH